MDRHSSLNHAESLYNDTLQKPKSRVQLMYTFIKRLHNNISYSSQLRDLPTTTLHRIFRQSLNI